MNYFQITVFWVEPSQKELLKCLGSWILIVSGSKLQLCQGWGVSGYLQKQNL